MLRAAERGDLPAIQELYRQLHPEDPVVDMSSTFEAVLGSPLLTIFLLELDGQAVATAYLNVIPNLTRSCRPYAVIENVVVDEAGVGPASGSS